MSSLVETPVTLSFPQRDESGIDQDCEWCEITRDGAQQRIRFHDYADIFSIPGLYEQLFYDVLECQSPKVVTEMLAAQADGLSGVRVLDVGAGNGMVGERLKALGADTVVGADILPEAAEATERDRPGVYDDYLVADLTALDDDQAAMLSSHDFNCLVSVAALGFGDIPPEAFCVAYDQVGDGGLVALTIKEDFLDAAEDESGFSRLVRRGIERGALAVLDQKRYRHRLSVTGEALHYVAIVAEKRGPLADCA